jgi:hypothetical protein
MDKVQKHNSFNTNTPSSESYKNKITKGFLGLENFDDDDDDDMDINRNWGSII